MRRATTIVLAVVAIVFVLIYVVPLFLPITWASRYNSRFTSMDIASGQLRHERYLLGVKVSDRLEETRLSEAYRQLVGNTSPAEWRTVRSDVPGYLINWMHGNSFFASRWLALAFEKGRFSDDAKRQALLTFFRLLQQDDNPDRAEEYALSIWATVNDDPPYRTIESAALPPPPESER